MSYFPKLILLKTGSLYNFCHKFTNMLLSSLFWHSFGRACDTLYSHHFILSINVNVLVPSAGKISFVVCDASLQGLTIRS